jgi:hypothetical protein
MVCYQVFARFAFIRHKAVLVATRIEETDAPPILVLSGLPYGHGLKYRRFFFTEKEAVRYVAHLRGLYKNRIDPYPPLPGGQKYLFQEVSE